MRRKCLSKYSKTQILVRFKPIEGLWMRVGEHVEKRYSNAKRPTKKIRKAFKLCKRREKSAIIETVLQNYL